MSRRHEAVSTSSSTEGVPYMISRELTHRLTSPGAALALITILALSAVRTPSAQAEAPGPRFRDVIHILDGSFEPLAFGPSFETRRWRDTRHRDHPRRYRDQIEFRYRDKGYESVEITGSFIDWTIRPMRLDEVKGMWIVRLDVEEGRHLYQFIVTDSLETWTAIDPSNPEVKKHPGHGWVSELTVDDAGDVVRFESTQKRLMRDEFAREYEDDDPGLTYQRVDGLFLYLTESHIGRERFEPSVQGRIGYGFKSERWSAAVTVLQPLLPGSRLMLKASGYGKTDFTDQTGISTSENTLAAIIFKEDFRDYYRREGGGLSVVFRGPDWFRAEGGFRADDYSSMREKTDWAISRGAFPVNPEIDAGTMRSIFAQAGIGTKWNRVDVDYEECGEDLLGGDFEFRRLTLQTRSRLRVNPGQHLDFRIRLGTNLSGMLPAQKRYVVGGLGTVRGYPYRSLLVADPATERDPNGPVRFGGERLFIANLEYAFDINDHFAMILFGDTGMAWEDRDAGMNPDDWLSSAGIGFQLDDDGLRLDLIRPLDRGDRDLVVQLRAGRMF